MQALLQNIINGLALGGVYALVALGYTMVYGVLQFINFAHSEIFMFGAFVCLYVAKWLQLSSGSFLNLLLVMVAAMIACTALGLFIERVAYRPLRSAPRLNVLITAIGVSLFLQNFGIVIFGADPQVFPALIDTHNLIEGDELIINNVQLIVIFVSLVLMLVLNWLIHHTKLGTAMRAVSFDIEISNLMGIPTDRVIGFTFALGTCLAAGAAALYGLAYPKVEPMMGTLIGLKAFVAAVFGGIGNIFGAAIGGMAMGLAEILVVYYISSSYRDAIAFGILIVILIFKPAGLFGTVRREKV